MTDIRDADEVWVGTSSTSDYVVAVPQEDFVRFLRADTAIPRAEADAMVAAVVERIAQERDAEARYWSEACNDDERVYHEMHAKKIRALTPADARAAFEQAIERSKLQSALDSLSNEIEVQKEVEQAVREAREEGFTSGRDKGFEEGRAMAHQHDKIFDEETTAFQVREAVEAERASWEPVADALWQLLDDMGIDGLSVCPAAKEEAVTSYMGKVHGLFPDFDVLPAAIRAPQEPRE